MPRQVDSDRYYWNGQRWVPSGTTVIGILDKPALMPWAANCAVDYVWECSALPILTEEMCTEARTAYQIKSQEARDYGTFIHWMCERFLTTGKPEPIPATFEIEEDEGNHTIEVDVELTRKFMDGWTYVTKTGKGKRATGFYEWCEANKIKPIAVEGKVLHDKYGGRFDLVCEMNGVVTLIDFKTGKGTYYDTWPIQLAGYRNGWNDTISNEAVDIEFNPKIPFGEATKHIRSNSIQAHGILKFNKDNGRINYKDFTSYQRTRTNQQTLEPEKYTRNYETDLNTFMGCVDLWWLINRGVKP